MSHAPVPHYSPTLIVSRSMNVCQQLTDNTFTQADSLTEEQVSEFKEAFSLFVCNSFPACEKTIDRMHVGQRWRWYVTNAYRSTSPPQIRPKAKATI